MKNNFFYLAIILVILLVAQFAMSWEIDLSRRRKDTAQSDMVKENGKQQNAEMGFLKEIFSSSKPQQEVVILNTEKGFIPQTIRLKKGTVYTFYIVNVNEKEKNISYILDAFSQFHATYYGKIATFEVIPQKEGVFSFQSPETSFEGRVVVYTEPGQRSLSSTNEK